MTADALAASHSPSASSPMLALGIASWALLVIGGFVWLAEYSGAPGRSARAPETWPAASAIDRDERRPTLLVVLHPRCSCSAATLVEVRRLLRDAPVAPDTWLVFTRPPGVAPDWHESATFTEASAMRGVHVLVDDGGVESARFDAATSGQTLLYATDGRLVFEGGITPARGHAGDSRGRDELLALLAGSATSAESTSVFGCPIDEDERARGGAR